VKFPQIPRFLRRAIQRLGVKVGSIGARFTTMIARESRLSLFGNHSERTIDFSPVSL
jgi:hypothetical protein